MRIYLIKASSGSDYSKYKAETGGPPQNIFAAAAATPKQHKIEMCDETIGLKVDLDSDADLVVIFMSTPDAYRAYELADHFYQKGAGVALGGLHTRFNQAEAQEHCHTVLIGEVEHYWEEMLQHFERGVPEARYESSEPVDLDTLNPYPIDILTPEVYNYTWSVVVSRGCPYKCAFCLVHEFFDAFNLRPIENIVAELWMLKEAGVEWVELHSDNLTHNKQYALDLFEAIAPTGLNFYGETTALIARDEELLQAAQQAGVKALLLGIETPSEVALKAQKKSFVKPAKMKEYVATIRKYGIEVWGDFLFGFDDHTPDIFEETLDFVKEIKVDKMIPHFVIPFPGSPTFAQLEREDRLLTRDWSRYDGSHVVYRPKNMSPQELEEGVYWVWQESAGFFEKLKSWF